MTDDRSEAARRLQSFRPRVTLVCAQCEREFEGYALGKGRQDQPRYCSNRCKMASRYQRKRAAP